MRSLVTGGAGFVGSHLCDRLLAEGHQIVILDSLLSGRSANVERFRDNARVSFVKHDVVDPWPDLGRFDRIYNLACPASPPQYQRDPVHTMLTSVQGVLHGLRLAERDGARFFQASTSEIYGDPEVHPQPETYRGSVNTLGPRACYDEGKRAAETLCMDFRRTRGVSVRIVRIFNTYGPRMAFDDGRVVSNFLVQALRGEPLTIYGEGQQTRSFCFVDDLIEGFIRLMEHPEDLDPVNLGNPGEFTMLELADEVERAVGKAIPRVFRPLPQDDPKQRRPDIGRANALLGFTPTVPLREGLLRTAAEFRQRLAG